MDFDAWRVKFDSGATSKQPTFAEMNPEQLAFWNANEQKEFDDLLAEQKASREKRDRLILLCRSLTK